MRPIRARQGKRYGETCIGDGEHPLHPLACHQAAYTTSGCEEHPQRSQPLVDPLSERELEVLHLIAAGASNEEIAEQLVIAIGTVKRHVSNILGKLTVSNRTQAVARAQAIGLLSIL